MQLSYKNLTVESLHTSANIINQISSSVAMFLAYDLHLFSILVQTHFQ